jgi:hypothetical protein
MQVCPALRALRANVAATQVDSDQIHQLEHFSRRRLTGSIDVIDVESPADNRLDFALVLFPSRNDSRAEACPRWTMSLPIHARYHPPSPHARLANITLDAPVICSACAVSGGRTSDPAASEVCRLLLGDSWWGSRFYLGPAPPLTLHVPVGDERQSPAVLRLTLLFIALGALYIVLA